MPLDASLICGLYRVSIEGNVGSNPRYRRKPALTGQFSRSVAKRLPAREKSQKGAWRWQFYELQAYPVPTHRWLPSPAMRAGGNPSPA